MEPVRMPITDVLDLHTFHPADIPDLLDDYLKACVRLGLSPVRIIHGKGSGIQRKRVQAILDRHPLVVRWQSAPAEAGGWGATLAELNIAVVEGANGPG
ncbi:MAG: Smr/MutS family protein [Desulfosarcinaceae bacterium]